ncbi:MAG: hypothetical protein CME26_10380 [Gemmatimonadetes bacterium]|mgnify:CR=1 FL=1|nr:hypothetical protein [Gemmatimonadota bacterium]|tara:strand:- start:310 stop:492 length:183 start_codon:yes stop_codon:yes gene_type:complete
MSATRKVTLKEIAERYNLRLSWLYERSRRGELPGMVRLGNLVRVDIEEFDKGVKEGRLSA